MKHILVLSLFVCLVVMALGWVFTYNAIVAHENAHVQSCEYLGGQASMEVKYDLAGIHGLTICSLANNQKYNEFAGMIEALSYMTVQNVLMTATSSVMLLIMMFLLTYKSNMRDDNEK
jgi:hypothetical protein